MALVTLLGGTMYKKFPFTLLKPKPFTVKRYSQGTWVKGEWVKAVATTLQIDMLAYEVKKHNDLIFLPEAVRVKKVLHILCNEELKELKEVPVRQEADEILYEGETYRIVQIGRFKNVSGFNGYQAYAGLVGTK